MKKIVCVTILVTTLSWLSFGQALNTLKLDSLLNALSSGEMAMGSVTISKNGVVKYQRAIGYSEISENKKIPADISTTYRIGSTTKMFTAVMIFQLIEEGKIKLTDRVGTYFPDLPYATKITIENLLSHRSGLHDYTQDTDFNNWMDKFKSQEELLEIIKEKGSVFEPGEKSVYSNSNYLLLGYIIERICNMSYAEILTKRITSRLRLKNTRFGNAGYASEHESVSYKYAEGKWTKSKQTYLNIHGGAGSIVSTPTDLVIFIDSLFSGKLVSQASLKKMITITDDYGMGMFANKYGSKPSLGHNGRIEEFYTALWHFPAEGLSFAYCTNGINYPRTDFIEGMLKICFNESFQIPFTVKNLKGGELQKYIGKYTSGDIEVNCTSHGSKLFLETRGKVFEVESIGDNYFMNEASGYFFEFRPGKRELLIKETDNVYFLKRSD